MAHPSLQLLVEEPVPGSFLWTVVETDDRGGRGRRLRSAEEPADSYEVALAAGTHALNAQLRAQGAPAPA